MINDRQSSPKLLYQRHRTINLTSYFLISLRFSVTVLSVKNTGNSEFDFTSLLHTYFAVENINSLKVSGLAGTGGFDQLKASECVAPDVISFSENVDTIYRQAENMIKIESDGGAVQLDRKNLPGKHYLVLLLPKLFVKKEDFGTTSLISHLTDIVIQIPVLFFLVKG